MRVIYIPNGSKLHRLAHSWIDIEQQEINLYHHNESEIRSVAFEIPDSI